MILGLLEDLKGSYKWMVSPSQKILVSWKLYPLEKLNINLKKTLQSFKSWIGGRNGF